jgi:hypothetical protein
MITRRSESMLKTQPNIQERFDRFRHQWRKETAHLSAVEQRALHPCYQHIIGMGPDVVPLILRELESRPDDWFWALTAITCENPISDDIRGNMRAMADAWVDWGRQKHLI